MIITQVQKKEEKFTTNQKYIFFENAFPSLKPLMLENISTVQQIEDYLSKHFPNIDQSVIGLRFSPNRHGVFNRIWLNGTISSDISDIYIYFYLKKHPRIM